MATNIKELTQHFSGLKQERSTWEHLWKDIRDYETPDLGAFEGENAYEGGKRYGRMYDAEAADCADILAAGLLGGVSSPSRPWLKLTTMDLELDKQPDVKEFLADVQNRMLMVFAKSEVYNALHRSYIELGAFGTACSIVQAHPERVVDMMNLTAGEYWLADDPYGRVDTMYRMVKMTAKQMVQKFGIDAVSDDVRTSLKDNPYRRFDVVHCIKPRQIRDVKKRDNRNKPWASIYWEKGRETILGESGYDDFPVLCPRWLTVGGGTYGRGPGAKALSAAKALQRLAKRLGVLTDYLSDPPIQYPARYAGQLQLFRPGGRIPVTAGDTDVLRSAWQVQATPEMLLQQIQDAKNQIQRYYHVNIFQMIAANQGTDRTATEIAALEQEKVMMLGPVLERLHTELLDPLVTNTFSLMVKADLIPEVPQALEGKELNVEYISILAEQQKNSSTNGVLRTIQQIGMLAQLKQDALDNLDADRAVNIIADANNVPPSMIVNGRQVALIRKQRADAQNAAAQQESALAMAQGMRDAGSAAASFASAEQQQPEGLDVALSAIQGNPQAQTM